MTLLMRLTMTMAALVLAMTVALGLLADRSFDLPVLFAGLAVELGILILTVMVAHYYLSGPLVEMAAPSRTLPQAAPEPARICPKGEIGIVARAFDRMAEEKGDKSCKLDLEGDKRRRTEALEQYAGRERMFIAAVESASHPVIAKALDGTITAWNPAAERLYQYTAGEAIGSDIDIIIPPERRDEQLVIVDKIRREEPVENFETVRMAKDGRRIDVAVSVSPVLSPNGEIIGLAEITRDITAQDFAEEKFRLAVEASPSGMVMIGAAGKVVLVNSEIERLFGYRRDELIGRSVDILVPERFRGQHVRHREGFLRTPQTRRMGAGRDLFGRRKDGTEFPVEVGLNPIETREGPLVLSVIVDITERKRMERLKDEFVSTVSHELRTPLTSITGSLGLLMGGVTGKMTERAVHLLTIAHSNSQRLVRLVNDILDIEKMESGQLNFNLARVDVRALVEQIVEANRGFSEGYGVRIRIDPATAEGEVHADPDRLAQVITNLLSNAVKISPSDDEVVLAIERRSDMVRISVQDRGPGIPAQFKPHVFEKFAQADATNARQKGGTGLGLSIVKEIVARLGGEVGFEDAPQGGTVFHVDLPSWDHAASREIDIDGALDARAYCCARIIRRRRSPCASGCGRLASPRTSPIPPPTRSPAR
jgi:PAS domain S-box-containing protein